MKLNLLNCLAGLLAVSCCAVFGAEPIVNGSFEEGAPGGLPDGWTHQPGNARSAIYLIDNIATEGRQALFIKNASQWKPGVYSSVFQSIPLKPNLRYRLSCSIKGENVKKLGFVIGDRWKIRFYPKVTENWKKHEFEFTLAPEDVKGGKAQFRILTEGLTDGAWIDEVRIQPVGGSVLTPADFQTERVLTAKRLTVPLESLTGIPEGFATVTLPAGEKFYTGKPMVSPDKFRGKIALAYDDEGIIVLADVAKRNVTGGGGNSMWCFDSVQIRINPESSFEGKHEPNDLEIGFSPAPAGVAAYSWTLKRQPTRDEVDLSGGVTPEGYRIAARLKWSLFDNPEFRNADSFSFNAIFNINFNGIREVAFLQRGIHDSKNKTQSVLVLFERERPTGFFKAVSRRNPAELAGTLFLTGPEQRESWTASAELTDKRGGKTVHPLADMPPVRRGEIVSRELRLPLLRVAEGEYGVAFAVPGGRISGGEAEKIDLLNKQLPELASLRKRFDAGRETVSRKGVSHPMLTVWSSVIERQLALQQRYLTQEQAPEKLEYYLALGERVNPELARTVADFEAAADSFVPLPAPEYRTGPIRGYRDGMPLVPAVTDGKEELRPMFFAGYGHFTDAIRDIPYFRKVGANLVQFETGPRHFLRKPGKNGAFIADPGEFRNRIEPALKAACENNVKISLLLSPHYHPGWWLDGHPELKRGNGLTHYEVNAPESRRMLNAYLDCLLPLLRDTPYRDGLHSIVLTNEPNYAGAIWSNPMTREFFQAWCEKKYGDISGFNRASGGKFGSFTELAGTDPAGNPAVNYEFEQFRRHTFADFHRFLAEKVKHCLPDMPVHVKIMIGTTYLPMGVDFAVDPELFAEFSDYNGNDAGMTWKFDRWVSAWSAINLSHDLQYSLRPMRIMNTENHIIRDGEERVIPPEHVYTAVFEQFLQGVGGIVTWVWVENTFERNRDAALRGSIHHRPSNIVAHAQALYDANRLAGPITVFVQAKPQIGILYSPSSLIQNSANWSASLTATHAALCFTGHKIGFISEKQLENGEFGEYRAIIATDATHVTQKAAEGLKQFAARGGKLFAAGRSPAFDSYGRPLPQMPAFASVKELKAWKKQLDAISPLPVTLRAEGGDTDGIFFRMVPDHDGSWLVNIVNYNREPRRITLSGGGTFRDLLAEKPFEPSPELAPLKPLFLRYYMP
ncbi:MAG: hypothetical protein HPZ91_01615 [Lentisphaeria bacterium]|nr:hypothetical protein [Lentisphaeria bacterium]